MNRDEGAERGGEGDWLLRVHPQPDVVGRARTSPGWVEPLRTIYNHELVIVSEGAFELEIEREAPAKAGRPRDVFRVEAPGYVIVPPGRLHVSREIRDAPLARHWVHFDWTPGAPPRDRPLITFWPGHVDRRLLTPAPAFAPPGVLRGALPGPAEALDIHARLLERWNRGSAHDRALCRGLLLELLIALFDRSSRQTRPVSPGERLASRMRPILERLSRRPMRETPTLEEAMKPLGRSYAHACRVFRRVYKVTPVAYVNALRIERARRLLTESPRSVAEVAYETGFESPAYFARLFRRQTGQSPRDYAALRR